MKAIEKVHGCGGGEHVKRILSMGIAKDLLWQPQKPAANGKKKK